MVLLLALCPSVHSVSVLTLSAFVILSLCLLFLTMLGWLSGTGRGHDTGPPLLLSFLYLLFSIFFSPFLSFLLFCFITLSCAVSLSFLLLHVLSQGTCSKLTRSIFRFHERCLFLRSLSASCSSLSCFPFSVLFCADCISALPFHVLHTPCHPTPSFSCRPLISSCHFSPLSWPFCWLATYTSPCLASCFLSAFC